MKRASCLVMTLGFAAGWFWQSNQTPVWMQAASSSRNPAESELVCPDQNEAERLIQRYKITFDLKDWSCSAEDTRSHMLAALMLTEKMSFKIQGPGWDPEFVKAVENLEDWLSRFTSSYNIDTNISDSTLAYYDIRANKTFMTERIRNYSLMEVFSILVHENRHAQAPDKLHHYCNAGDMPQMMGACDRAFSDRMSEMGSYNFTTLFEMATVLFNEKLSDAERDHFAISVLEMLSSRFNEVPGEFGQFYENLVVLNEDKQPFVVMPFSNNLAALPFTEKIEHIESAVFPLRTSMFTEGGEWLTWHIISGKGPIHQEALKGKKVRDGNRVHPFTVGYATDVILNEGQPEVLINDPITKKKTTKEFFYMSSDEKRQDLIRIQLSDFQQSFYLSKEGKLLRARQYANEEAFQEIPSDKKWIQLSADPLYEGLYLVSDKGEVYTLKTEQLTVEDSTHPEGVREVTKWNLLPAESTQKLSVKKYYRGLLAEYVLTTQHEIMIKANANSNFESVRLSKPVTDLAVLKTFSLSSADLLKTSLSDQKKFETTCGVQSSVLEPWLHRPMGIDVNQNLIRFSLHSECEKMAAKGAVKSFEFSHKEGSPVMKLETASGLQVIKPF